MEFFYEFWTLLFGEESPGATTDPEATNDNIVWSMGLPR